MTFITYLKQVQKKSGLSQNKFAEKVGVSGSMISRIFSGDRKPSVKIIKNVCELNKEPDKANTFCLQVMLGAKSYLKS
jgi:transcriptional regulator with XRE-family HTH domain